MSKKSQSVSEEHTPSPTQKSATILLLRDMADTSWRMFIPIIGIMLIGLYGDVLFHTKPVLLLIGLGIGIIVSALLVKRQLKKVK